MDAIIGCRSPVDKDRISRRIADGCLAAIDAACHGAVCDRRLVIRHIPGRRCLHEFCSRGHAVHSTVCHNQNISVRRAVAAIRCIRLAYDTAITDDHHIIIHFPFCISTPVSRTDETVKRARPCSVLHRRTIDRESIIIQRTGT